ncbi:RIP metalloprotease, partial [Chloroflexota bacterium]
MTVFITIISFLGILAVLILAHELGHFATAKAFKVRVDEFGLGFPPKLLSFKRGETRYSLNAIPLGGFTKMAGEVDPDEPRSLASKNAGIRILVLSAGSIMNALLPLLLFSIAFMVPHNAIVGDVVVMEVSADSPAASAGIEPGDLVLNINNRPVNSTNDLTRYLQLYLGREISVTVGRGDTTEDVYLTPRWKPPEGEGVTGMLVGMPDLTVVHQSYPFWEAIPLGFRECGETFVLFKNAVLGLFSGAMQFQVGGPVAIAQMTGEVAQAGFSPLLEFAAFLSIN